MLIIKFKKRLADNVHGAELIDWKACGIESMTGVIAIDPAPTPFGQSALFIPVIDILGIKIWGFGKAKKARILAIDRTRRRLSSIRSNDA